MADHATKLGLNTHCDIEGTERDFVNAAADEPLLERLTQHDFESCCAMARRGMHIELVLAVARRRAVDPSPDPRGAAARCQRSKRSAAPA